MCHLNCVDGHFSHDHGVTQGTWAGGGAYFKRHRLVHIDDLQQATLKGRPKSIDFGHLHSRDGVDIAHGRLIRKLELVPLALGCQKPIQGRLRGRRQDVKTFIALYQVVYGVEDRVESHHQTHLTDLQVVLVRLFLEQKKLICSQKQILPICATHARSGIAFVRVIDIELHGTDHGGKQRNAHIRDLFGQGVGNVLTLAGCVSIQNLIEQRAKHLHVVGHFSHLVHGTEFVQDWYTSPSRALYDARVAVEEEQLSAFESPHVGRDATAQSDQQGLFAHSLDQHSLAASRVHN
mmetsp:Transcript_53754/g.117584  ORF Transcript_53754/g.117584 Transcript_53754/m.117584 type:complete len:292 (+) Transcript_53754:1351-2226(+)